MSWLIWLIVIVVLIIVIGLVTKILSGLARVIFSSAILILIVGAGGWILYDVNDLRQNFYNQDKLFLLDVDRKLAGAFALQEGTQPRIMSDLSAWQNIYPGLRQIMEESGEAMPYKIIVITWPVVADDLQLNSFTATSAELHDALRSDNSKELFIVKGVEEYGEEARGQVKLQADELYPTNDAFSSTVFALLAEKPLRDQQLMMNGLRDGTVEIYPETIVFKIIKVLPEELGNALFPAQTEE